MVEESEAVWKFEIVLVLDGNNIVFGCHDTAYCIHYSEPKVFCSIERLQVPKNKFSNYSVDGCSKTDGDLIFVRKCDYKSVHSREEYTLIF